MINWFFSTASHWRRTESCFLLIWRNMIFSRRASERLDPLYHHSAIFFPVHNHGLLHFWYFEAIHQLRSRCGLQFHFKIGIKILLVLCDLIILKLVFYRGKCYFPLINIRFVLSIVIRCWNKNPNEVKQFIKIYSNERFDFQIWNYWNEKK